VPDVILAAIEAHRDRAGPDVDDDPSFPALLDHGGKAAVGRDLDPARRRVDHLGEVAYGAHLPGVEIDVYQGSADQREPRRARAIGESPSSRRDRTVIPSACMDRRLLLLVGTLGACSTSAAPTASGPVRIVEAPAGEVAPLVIAAEAEAAREHRRLLVYVGAVWCEPCLAFHEAAARGELDASLPGVTLLEFDLDLDEARLAAAGYESEMIPLFVVPGPDGRATARATSGARKGGDYVGQLVPRLQALF